MVRHVVAVPARRVAQRRLVTNLPDAPPAAAPLADRYSPRRRRSSPASSNSRPTTDPLGARARRPTKRRASARVRCSCSCPPRVGRGACAVGSSSAAAPSLGRRPVGPHARGLAGRRRRAGHGARAACRRVCGAVIIDADDESYRIERRADLGRGVDVCASGVVVTAAPLWCTSIIPSPVALGRRRLRQRGADLVGAGRASTWSTGATSDPHDGVLSPSRADGRPPRPRG